MAHAQTHTSWYSACKKSKTGTIVHCYGRRYCRCRGIIAMSHANLHACMEANAKNNKAKIIPRCSYQ